MKVATLFRAILVLAMAAVLVCVPLGCEYLQVEGPPFMHKWKQTDHHGIEQDAANGAVAGAAGLLAVALVAGIIFCVAAEAAATEEKK